MNSKRSWLIFAGGVVAYLVAVTQRSSLSVAGVDAAERFHSSAAALSSLAALQLIVYAAMQIPVGVLVDRLGPKALLAGGAVLMIAGQVIVALSPELAGAVVGRILVGAGDAATFISVLRLLNTWFSGPRVPQLSQWFGALGQLGQVLSALPFAVILHSAGWTPAFLSAASLSVIALIVILILVSDGRGMVPTAERSTTIREAIDQLRASLKRPGTQLGFWAHFTTQSTTNVFALFWGFPFMVSALGLDQSLAATMLTLIVAVGLVAGPILGLLTARFPMRRSNLVLGILIFLGIAWTAILVWPAVPPVWLLVVLVVALGIGGPASQIGFDFARTFNPAKSLGSANGIVNVGGFAASFTIMLLIGFILDIHHSIVPAAPLYSLQSFRIAFLIQYVVIGFGVIMLVRARRHTRRRLFDDGGITVGPLWVVVLGALRRGRKQRTGNGSV